MGPRGAKSKFYKHFQFSVNMTNVRVSRLLLYGTRGRLIIYMGVNRAAVFRLLHARALLLAALDRDIDHES